MTVLLTLFRLQTLLICGGLYMILFWSIYVQELGPPEPETLGVRRSPRLAEVYNTIAIWQVKEKL